MPNRLKAADAFEAALNEGAEGVSPQVKRLALLASALAEPHPAEPDARFRMRLRSELLAHASATEEEIFAAALAGSSQTARAEMRQLVTVASALEPTSLPVPDVTFRYSLRNQLIAEGAHKTTVAARVADRVATLNNRMRRSFRLVTATGMAALMMLAGSAAMAASSGSLPGDAIYSLKRLKEAAELTVISGEREGVRLLGFARTRLVELKGLNEREESNQTLYVSTLGEMDRLTHRGATILISEFRAARKPAALEQLRAFARVQQEELNELVGVLPVAVRPAALDSLTLVESIERRALIVLGNPQCPCPDDPLVPTPGGESAEADQSDAVACECDPSATDSAAQPPAEEQDDSPQGRPDDSGDGDGDDGDRDDDGDGDGDRDVDVPDVDGTNADEQIEEAINDLLDDLDETPLPDPLPSGTAPLPQPSL